MQLTLLVSAVVVLVLWLYVRNRGTSQQTAEAEKLKAAENTAYHAVSIKFDSNACDAAARSTSQTVDALTPQKK